MNWPYGWVLVLALILSLAPKGLSAGKWELQYQHIDAEYDLRLLDIAFIDAKHGLASGFLDSRKRERQQPVNLVTSDGKNWSVIETKKICTDIHAVSEGMIFAACEDGIYRSDELGKDWKRVAKIKNILSIWFTSPLRGFAVGLEKSFFETSDGGEKWAPVETNPAITTSKDYTLLHHIDFASPNVGLITGWSRIPRNREFLPDWMAPDRALQQRDTPHVNFIIETRDAGATWTSQEVSMFGEINSVYVAPDGAGLGLVKFSNGFEVPSEVFFFKWPSGTTVRVFREKNRAVTDVALPQRGPAYLAAVEPGGQLFWSPIPGRVKILESADFTTWTEMDVDYRASATGVRFAAFDPENIWAISDTGVILKLNRDFTALPARTLPEGPARPETPEAERKPSAQTKPNP